MQRSREESPGIETEAETAELDGEETASPVRFAAAGPLPAIFTGGAAAAATASDRAYGNDRGSDEPLSPEGRVMDRVAKQDAKAIEEASKRYGVPEVDILAVITHESRGIATANAGASQRDGGRNSASGLMQVTHETWKNTQNNHSELAKYGFHAFRYDRRVNILVGTAALRDKRVALERLGVDATGENGTALTTMAFNAGEGIVSDAYHRAERAGSRNPAEDCLKEEFLKPAIAKYPSVYSYYLTGGGKGRNPGRTKERAVELKFLEISKYPAKVEMLIAEATEHEMVEEEVDMPAPLEEDRTALA